MNINLINFEIQIKNQGGSRVFADGCAASALRLQRRRDSGTGYQALQQAHERLQLQGGFQLRQGLRRTEL